MLILLKIALFFQRILRLIKRWLYFLLNIGKSSWAYFCENAFDVTFFLENIFQSKYRSRWGFWNTINWQRRHFISFIIRVKVYHIYLLLILNFLSKTHFSVLSLQNISRLIIAKTFKLWSIQFNFRCICWSICFS